MANSFRDLEDIAGAVKARLETLAVFKSVSYAGISGASQLFELIDTLNIRPAAVICLGDLNYDAHQLTRGLRMIIAFADNYRLGTAGSAKGAWPLVRAVESAFTAPFSGAESGVEIGGVHWSLQQVRPVESGDRVTLYFAVIQGDEPLARL